MSTLNLFMQNFSNMFCLALALSLLPPFLTHLRYGLDSVHV